VPSRLDPVLLEPIAERSRIAEAEEPRGAGLVASGVLHGLFEIMTRDAVDDGIEINALANVRGQHGIAGRGVAGGGLGAGPQGVAGVIEVDDRTRGPDGGAAQRVQQLADVARPAVAEQKISCGDGEFLALEAGARRRSRR